MNESVNGYTLTREWFNWCFDNPEKVKPIHTALYLFIVDHANRMGWKEKFGLPAYHAMESLGIKNWRTYKGAFDDLVKFKAIRVISHSKNQYTANVIALVNNTKAPTKALDKALSKHIPKHCRSTAAIDKPINLETNKPINRLDNYLSSIEFDEFWELYPKGINKGSKQAAFETWKEIVMDEKEVLEKFKKAVVWQLDRECFSRDLDKHPSPSKYIREKRWDNEEIKAEERNPSAMG